ncbi:zinc-dependent metalloprotease [Frigoriflavimonas asaccharolytica]|uniref:Secretion system C-terminal sorting domain-containing protein n=1 Tax=Frigoriflavimonas asaccharolytica TaxID=2735899 RepID=A0A8J8G9K6_9FLAO|nr:zinc-dependent metalloprotease [Frigoriflavimonas asaccharolytica]NRS92039.1 hypothetical protein [Frigoriflavimonas asaccharolytica]
MKILLLFLSFTCSLFFSQSISENEIPGKVFPISISSLQNKVNLQKASTKPIKNISIALPNISGNLIKYNLTENNLTEKRLNNLITFDGVSEDGFSTLKLSLFNDRFEAIIKNKEGFFYIEPYETSAGNYRVYPAFADFGKNFTCDISQDEDILRELNTIKSSLIAKASAPNFPYGNQMRKFRMAIATTGEFTQAFAGNQDNALAEAVTMMNLINLIYESEVSISFTIIAKTTDKTLIFTNPSTDPFTVDPSFASAANSQTGFTTLNTNGTLAYSLYDIGHTFNVITSGGAQGQAGTQPCSNTAKARAWSQWTLTLPKSITANLIVHEMGHQFGAGHTYNAVGGSSGSPTFCTSGWSSISAVEPGAGTTIMSYGNNCTTPDNQTNSGNNGLNYFNAKSLDQITANLVASATCFTLQNSSNVAPSANAGLDITIPKNTPFFLRGIGTDSNDANLSYTWEQANNASANDKGSFGNSISGTGGYTANNSTASAPLFRSAQSTANGERNFPRLQFVLNNANVPPIAEAEVLPAVARSMKFRFTVRDNNAQSGGVDSDEMTVTVSNNGPLQVAYPNATGVSVAAQSSQTITWNVNGTNALNANVNILLSTDGGISYPYQLAMNTPNDGTQTVTIPNSPATSTARVKVVAVINPNAEYFDVSDNNFAITSICNAYNSYINPTSTVSTTVGSAESNLNMVAPPAAGNSFTVKNVDYSTATNNNVYAYSNSTYTTSTLAANNYPSVQYSFRVTNTGTYTFTKSSGFLILSIHSGSPFTASNFVGSNAYSTGSAGSYSSQTSTQSLALTEGVTYYAVLCNFSNPANTATYTITSNGPGSLYDVNASPIGISYRFIAINTADSKIKAVSTTANFSSLPIGTYNVQGISYPTATNSASFVNSTLAELATNGICFATSGNNRTLQLNQVLGTFESPILAEEFILAPNPVGNYLSVKTKMKISNYQIFDMAGRLIQAKNFAGNSIDVSSLQTGTYFISLLNEGKVLHQEKIIKK